MNEWTKDRKNESLRPRESNSDRITFHIAESATRMQKLSLFSESRNKKKTITIVWGHASDNVLGEKKIRDNQ